MTQIEKTPVTLRFMNGSVIVFDDADYMTRACGRLTQVMVFGGERFSLNEAIGDRDVAGATILKDDLREFMRIFEEKEHSPEEISFIKEIGDQDFVVALHRPELSAGLMMHELHHVLFYYEETYRNAITSLWNGLYEIDQFIVTERLKELGYEKVEYIDEWFAHLLYGFFDAEDLIEGNAQLMNLYNSIVEELLKLTGEIFAGH